MYRKSLVAALMLLYSASAIGVPLHFHYCQGELKHVSFLLKMECHDIGSESTGHACCQKAQLHCGSGHTLNSCCDDATQWLQEDISALCAKSELDLSGDWSTPTCPCSLQNICTDSGVSISNGSSESGSNPLYLIQCAFIFYG